MAGGTTDKLDIYDPVKNRWSSGAPLPGVRGGAGAAVIGGKLYIVSGTDVLAYSPAKDEWTAKASLPTARGLVAVAKIAIAGQPTS